MERIISPEERIRRAEEIYYRRKMQGVRVSTSTVNIGKKNKVSLGKKMGIQIAICILIYTIFYTMKGYNNVFSENLINNTRQILNYDINFQNLYNQFMEYFNNNFNNILQIDNKINNNLKNDNGNENIENDIVDENKTENTNDTQDENGNTTSVDNTEENNTNENTISENPGIGGGTENIENNMENSAENKSQMELDAEYVKQNYSLIIPVKGYITSGFGNREATEIISAFHQGVDIGAVTGTSIYASMEGTVIAASWAGDYGNHIKIQNGNVLTVYAHCSQINVNVGDYISQGQEIGKVGATGKVTGPHLHFEVRKDNRYVDPTLILNF